jgi:hypothetical protein
MLNFKTLTAPQKAMYLVLVRLSQFRKTEVPELADGAAIAELYATEYANDDGYFQDARNETRNGIEVPEITKGSPCSRNYEFDANVGKLPDGSYVGWWFAYGGGKHSEPDYAIDWVADAFDVTHAAEEVTITKHTFTKVEPA